MSSVKEQLDKIFRKISYNMTFQSCLMNDDIDTLFDYMFDPIISPDDTEITILATYLTMKTKFAAERHKNFSILKKKDIDLSSAELKQKKSLRMHIKNEVREDVDKYLHTLQKSLSKTNSNEENIDVNKGVNRIIDEILDLFEETGGIAPWNGARKAKRGIKKIWNAIRKKKTSDYIKDQIRELLDDIKKEEAQLAKILKKKGVPEKRIEMWCRKIGIKETDLIGFQHDLEKELKKDAEKNKVKKKDAQV